jgi:hypothetical protein
MNDAITISIIGGAFAIGALIIRYLFYSKCTTVKCCGCVVTRDIRREEHDPEHSHNTTSI